MKFRPYVLLACSIVFTFSLTGCDYSSYVNNGGQPDSLPEIKSSYVKDGDDIIYRSLTSEGKILSEQRVINADDTTFQSIDTQFAKDRKSVYFKGMKIYGADPVSFQILKKGFSMDKNSTFFEMTKIQGLGGRVIPENVSFDTYQRTIDPDSFEVVSNSFIRDKNQAFLFDGRRVRPLDVKDPASFEVIDMFYGRDSQYVYDILQGSVKIEGLDPATFEPISYGFVKDKNGVYRWTNHVGLQKFEDIDPETFRVIDNTYAGDKNNVYVVEYDNLKKISGADMATFEPLNEYVSKDKNHVYFRYELVPDALADSFSIMNTFYAKDAQAAYYYDYRYMKRLEVDSASFEVLGNFYSKDKSAVYYQHWKVEGADPATFEVLSGKPGYKKDGYFGKDKNGYYEQYGKVEEDKIRSFTVDEVINKITKEKGVSKEAVEAYLKTKNIDKDMIDENTLSMVVDSVGDMSKEDIQNEIMTIDQLVDIIAKEKGVSSQKLLEILKNNNLPIDKLGEASAKAILESIRRMDQKTFDAMKTMPAS